MKRTLAVVLALGLVAGNMPLTADPTDTSQPPVSEINPAAPAPVVSSEQLEALVAPIALYPDPLISQILVASTYPLELVQAGQWQQQHPELKGQALKDAATQQSWDPSIQALVLFPDVVKRLNSDVTWTTNLGNAFLANQGSVMDAIQRMRVKAEEAGKLKSSPQEKVTNTTQSGQPIVEIEPADPDIIYVPEYNPVWIWGSPAGYYYPAWYYPPPPPFGVWFFWGAAFSMSLYYPGWIGYGGWGGWGWRPGWRDHSVYMNHGFMTHNHYNAGPMGSHSAWEHNPAHRSGVAYSNHAVAQHFNASGVGRPAVARPTVSHVQQQFHQRAISSGVGSDRIGNRSVMSNSATSNRSAFGGTQHGSNARVYSNQGRSSLGHAATVGASRPSGPRGGGAGGANRSSGSRGGSAGGGHGGGGGGRR